jgi:hypothetical protein
MLGGKSLFDGTEEFSQVSLSVMMSGLVELIISSRSDFLLQTDWKFMLRTLMGLLTLFLRSIQIHGCKQCVMGMPKLWYTKFLNCSI